MSVLMLLSTPYTYKVKDPSVYEQNRKMSMEHSRLVATTQMANHLTSLGIYVFSPIVYGLALIQGGLRLPATWEFWQGYCEASVRACESVYVVNMDGWEESTGVAGEISEAKKWGKKVFLIEFDLHGPLKIIKEL